MDFPKFVLTDLAFILMSSLDLGGLCLHIYIFLPPEWILWIVPSACLKLLSFSSVCSDLWLTPILIFCFNYRIAQFRSAAPFIICTSLLRFLFYSLIISWLLLLHCPHFLSFNAAKVSSLVIQRVCFLKDDFFPSSTYKSCAFLFLIFFTIIMSPFIFLINNSIISILLM